MDYSIIIVKDTGAPGGEGNTVVSSLAGTYPDFNPDATKMNAQQALDDCNNKCAEGFYAAMVEPGSFQIGQLFAG